MSYVYSKAEAKLLLNRLCKKGQLLCEDPYLEIFNVESYNVTIRFAKSIDAFNKFVEQKSGLKFNDNISMELYLDFKRESKETIAKVVESIGRCENIRDLTIEGSPNPYFTDLLFGMLKNNQSI